MTGGSYDRRDAAGYNETLQAWIDDGELMVVEMPDGDDLLAAK